MARKASGGKMRNIKFRVWNNNEDVFHCLQFTDTGIKTEDDPMTRGCVVYQQYTGLKDENGQEIYEGDILLWEQGWMYPEMNGEIQWVENGYYFVQPEHNVKWLLTQKSLSTAKIMGNIFEGVDKYPATPKKDHKHENQLV